VREELELTDDQIEAIRKVRQRITEETNLAGFRASQNKILGVRRSELVQEIAKETQRRAVEDVERILLPHQTRRLRQIDLQRRIRGTSFALFTSSVIARELEYTPEQSAEIPRLVKELEREVVAVLSRERQRAMNKILDKLSEEQRKKYREVVGEEFNFDGLVVDDTPKK
jgi:hypothetical protein